MPHNATMTDDEDLYDVDPRAENPDKAKAEETESETALLPKSFFQGKELEIGKRCEVEIERLLDEEVEVSLVPHAYAKEEMEAVRELDDSLYE